MVVPALLAAAAVWLLVLPSPRSRARSVLGPPRTRRPVDLGLVAGSCAALTCVLLLGWPFGLVVGVPAGFAARQAVGRLESVQQRHRRAAVARQLPGALDLVVATLSAGRTPASAFGLVAGAAPEPLAAMLRTVARQLELTADPRDVWAALRGHPELGAVGRAFERADTSGVPASRLVAQVASECRRRRAADLRRRSRTVAVSTAGPLGACFLPAFLLVGIVPTVVGTVANLGL